MAVIFIYAVIVIISDAAVVMIAGSLEQYSHSGSLMVFFGLFTLVFWLGWILAVRITERFVTA